MPLLFLVSALVFVLTSLTPGDLTYVILGGPPKITGIPESVYQRLAHQLHLDQPLWTQYWDWLTHALHGDLGKSAISKTPVTDLVLIHLPVTLSLLAGTLLVSLLFGVCMGIASAIRGGPLGRTVDILALVGWMVPVFWLAAELIVVFAVKLRWFPAIGYVSFAQSPVQWFRSLVLPVVALSVGAIAGFAKFTREAMLDALASEYIRMARANGESRRSVVFQHALKSASVQIVTLTGLITIGLLTGTVFVENVFSLPGLGSQIVTAVNARDLPVVQGIAVFFTLIVISVNLLTDLAYTAVSPKVRVE